LSELAEQTGAKVALISRNSEEGDSLYRAFGGMAAILRYAVDLF
jgi:peptide chain release factor subunit 1